MGYRCRSWGRRHLPLGVALLLAAVLGVLLVVIPGSGRIIQLRIVARRHRPLDTKTTAAAPTLPAPTSSPPSQEQPCSGPAQVHRQGDSCEGGAASGPSAIPRR